jgi:hypothetical protein
LLKARVMELSSRLGAAQDAFPATEETIMLMNQYTVLAERALADIDQLLNNFDHGAQIETALPLLRTHRRTLAQLQGIIDESGRTTATLDSHPRWVDDLVLVYGQFGGQATDRLIYKAMEELRRQERRSWPRRAREATRQTRRVAAV